MKATLFSLFNRLIPKRWLPTHGEERHDVLHRERRANKIPDYYIKYTINALRVISWIVLVLGFISALVWGITTGGNEGGLQIVLVILVSFLAWLALLAARELLKLFVDVKENTGNTSERTDITDKLR
jgi:hypothetical protein